MQSLGHYLNQPKDFAISLLQYLGVWLPDRLYLKWMFRLKMGYQLDLRNPKTFSAKLQWLKLYDRRPEYSAMVDKYLVKDYVAKIIGQEYVIPTLGVWNRPEEIDWDSLPDQFVLKTSHDGGSCGVVICREKNAFDKENAIAKLRQSLSYNSYKGGREWPYKNVRKMIIAEQFLNVQPEIKDLPDYKWYCFDGEPKYCQVIQGRNTNETIDFFDIYWEHQGFVGLNPSLGPTIGSASVLPTCPHDLTTQIMIARKLSQHLPFARIDLYEANGKVYFGEITFFPMSGFGVFSPIEYNYKLGEMLVLPSVVRN